MSIRLICPQVLSGALALCVIAQARSCAISFFPDWPKLLGPRGKRGPCWELQRKLGRIKEMRIEGEIDKTEYQKRKKKTEGLLLKAEQKVRNAPPLFCRESIFSSFSPL